MRSGISVLGALIICSGAGAQGTPRKLTVEEAIQLAMEASDGLRAARLHKAATDNTARSVRGRLLPSISVSDEAQHYDSPFAFAFPLPHAPGGPSAPPLAFTVRNIDTNSFAVAAGQPVLGLLHLSQDHAAVESSADSADAQAQVIEDAIRQGAQTGFLQLFEARATQEIARASEQELAEQVSVAQSKVKAGVLTTADVLRVQVAAANARQQEIQAQAQEEVTRAALLTAMGLDPDDATVDFVEPTALENAPAPAIDQSLAEARAAQRRHEVFVAQSTAEAARHSERAQLFQLLPEVNIEAAYAHLTGEVLAPTDQEYVGINASWPIWEWGTRWFAMKAASDQAEAAEAQLQDQTRQVRLDASTKLSLAHAAAHAVETAQATIASAEEAYRVTQALVRAGTATTTDLLDSQSALTQARLNLVKARYEQAIALVALDRATGG